MNKHTELPWEVAQECTHAGQVCTCHGDKDTWYEVWTPNWQNGIDQEANAAFIVKACNEHYELLKLLTTAYDLVAESVSSTKQYDYAARAASLVSRVERFMKQAEGEA